MSDAFSLLNAFIPWIVPIVIIGTVWYLTKPYIEKAYKNYKLKKIVTKNE